MGGWGVFRHRRGGDLGQLRGGLGGVEFGFGVGEETGEDELSGLSGVGGMGFGFGWCRENWGGEC